MATVIKGNTMLQIPDDRVADYVASGYDIANKAGVVTKKAIPTDLAELQKLYTDQVAKIAQLEKKVKESEQLQADYDKLLASYEELEDKNSEFEAELLAVKETPKKTTKKKTAE